MVFLNTMGALGIMHIINIMGCVRDVPDSAYFISWQLCIVKPTRLSFGQVILQTKRMYKWSILKLIICVFVLKYKSEMWWKFRLCTDSWSHNLVMASVQKPIISWQLCNFLRIVHMCLYVLGMIGQTWLSVNSHFDSKKLKPMKIGARCYEDSLFAMQ